MESLAVALCLALSKNRTQKWGSIEGREGRLYPSAVSASKTGKRHPTASVSSKGPNAPRAIRNSSVSRNEFLQNGRNFASSELFVCK